MAVGAAAGLLVSLWSTRLLENLLYEVAPRDPRTVGLVVFVLMIAGLLATMIPARTACRLDPVRALRAD
ncbi:MAG: hypothetical protein JSW51_03175 [Gemmatimonadota bacterium]|nr:MAG: hypothetical protein JSW51_03175 [Gemmatimonadota bacterium]